MKKSCIESILGDVGAALNATTPEESRRILETLAAGLRYQLTEATAADEGAAGLLKAMKSILKATAKDPRETLRKSWIDAAGRQCVCDGFRAIRSREHFPFDLLPADVQPLNLERVFVTVENGARLPDVDRELFTQWFATQRAEWKTANDARPRKERKPFAPVYNFGFQLPKVNAVYLREMLEALPGAKIFYNPGKSVFSPVHFVGENGDALILPIRTVERKATEEEKAAALEKLGISADDLPEFIGTRRDRLQKATKYRDEAKQSLDTVTCQYFEALRKVQDAPKEDGAAVVGFGDFENVIDAQKRRDEFQEMFDRRDDRVTELRAVLRLAESIA